MQTRSVNKDLCQWVDEKCNLIRSATGARRYRMFASAIYALNAGQGEAPLSPAFNDRGDWCGGSDETETIMTLQTLCWCAEAVGVKETTVRRIYERELKRV